MEPCGLCGEWPEACECWDYEDPWTMPEPAYGYFDDADHLD